MGDTEAATEERTGAVEGSIFPEEGVLDPGEGTTVDPGDGTIGPLEAILCEGQENPPPRELVDAEERGGIPLGPYISKGGLGVGKGVAAPGEGLREGPTHPPPGDGFTSAEGEGAPGGPFDPGSGKGMTEGFG